MSAPARAADAIANSTPSFSVRFSACPIAAVAAFRGAPPSGGATRPALRRRASFIAHPIAVASFPPGASPALRAAMRDGTPGLDEAACYGASGPGDTFCIAAANPAHSPAIREAR
jgi:hypothetical protein